VYDLFSDDYKASVLRDTSFRMFNTYKWTRIDVGVCVTH